MIYFKSASQQMKPQIQEFEKAATGAVLKEKLLKCLAIANQLHSKKFGTEAKNE